MINVPAAAGGSLPIFAGYRGPNETLIALINEILAAMLRTTDPTMSKARIGIGRKGNRELSVFCTRQGQAEEVVAPELSQLSSGQLMALGLATEIIRAHELLSGSTPSSLDDVRGIAVVDEIDLHLHIAFQKLVLPTLIRKLPRVQFLVTTHSPFFLLRMSETGDVDIYSLPIRKR